LYVVLPVVLLALLLVALAGARVLRRAAPVADAGAATAQTALPDAPSAQEQQLLQRLATAASGDGAPGRELGAFYLDAGRPFGALWAYAHAAHASPRDAATSLGLARAAEAALFPEIAEARFEAALAADPLQTEALTRLAELLLRTGQPERALQLLQQQTGARARRAKSASAASTERAEGAPSGSGATPERERSDLPILEGRLRQAMGDLSGAEQAYRRALARDNQDGITWHRLGLLLLAAGRRDAARQALERARALQPSEPRLLVDLGRVLAASGTAEDRKRAMELYRAAVRERPYAPAYFHSSLLLLGTGQWDAAATGLTRALAVDSNHAEAHREYARVLDAGGRRAEARYQRGLYYSVKDLRARSVREYLAQAEADPKRPDGLLMASQGYFKMTLKAEATAAARRAWARFPGNPKVREQVAALLLLSHNRRAAKALCEEWLKSEPDAPNALWLLGRIAINERRFAEGVRLHERALAKQPENVDILQSLGDGLLEAPGEGNPQRALEIFQRVAALAPANAKARYQLGIALMRSGRPEEAQRQLLRCLDLDPHTGEAYNVLVQLARRLKQPGPVAVFGPMVRDVEERLRDELMLWRRTWDHPNDPNGFLALGRFLVRRGDLRRAESQLEEALALRPGWPAAAAELGRVRGCLAAGPDDPGVKEEY
jgi:tetratricopeptide (TPR) repeat protein